MAGGVVNRRYAYDKAGNLIQSADQRSGVLNYVYDKIGRIQEARNSQTGRSETFAFDPAHNILSDKAAEGKGNNLVSGNRLKEYNGIEYTYDALGNLIYRQLPNGENQYYQYDLENQLVRAEIKKPAGNTEIWTYAYDPFGRRLSKERQDKLAWTSTDPKRTHFVWDGTRLLQEYTYKGSYTYIYTDQDSYEPLAQIFDNAKDSKQYLAYFHNDQISIPREMTDIHGNLLWYGEYTAWGRLKKDERVYKNAHQPFRLQNQYFDEETGLHYNLMRYYEPEAGRFVNQDPIGLLGGDNLYAFAPSTQAWVDPLGLANLFDIGTYGSLNSSTHVGDGLQAHELIRHEALVQNGYTTKNNRLSQNPAIALDLDHHTRGPAKDTRGIGGTHYHEAEIRRSHYGLGRNQMHTDLHREIDIAQGGLRKTGTPKAQRKRLRKEAKKFLRKLKKTGKKCP
ncbi:RHS repeat-associated core domain-containing protein [Neisseria sp. HMSC067G11]|uniref:RHS repeat-associated core domain-containing protein n=2 Tax=unclassified Neisseria TaxID=2623750 RepID=UPI0009A51117